MKKITQIMVTTMQAIIACLLAFMIVINVLQMVTRYFIAVQIMWVEDYSIMCLYWIFALGTPMVWLLGQHMYMDILAKVIKGKFDKILYFVMQGCAFAAGIGLMATGFKAAKSNYGYIMSIAGFDEVWRYIPIFVGGLLLSLASIIVVINKVQEDKHKEVQVKEAINE